jgi:hypothetical protein
MRLPFVAYEVTRSAPQGLGEEQKDAASGLLGAMPLEIVLRQMAQALVDALPELRGMSVAVCEVERPADWEEPTWERKEAEVG